MPEQRRYEVLPGNHGSRVKVKIRGRGILRTPRLNRGTAFTSEERELLGLVGLLPTGVTPIDAQVHRAYEQFLEARLPMAKFRRLAALRDRNTVLFYRLISEHLEEMMPIVYTPTIGDAIEQFSRQFTRLDGVFLSIDSPDAIEESLRASGRTAEDVDIIVVTDSEGILGIGDQGVGGILICHGKMSLYTAAAGVDPDRMIAVGLDVGTDNLGLLNDDLYPGLRHARVRGRRYDEFVEAFVAAAQRVFPRAMIHWEDFGAANAHRILTRYRDEVCTFNDDVQGTAAVVGAAALAAVRAKGERLRDQRIVVHGAGTAGVGIADLMRDMMAGEGLDDEAAHERFWCLNSRGLITDASSGVRDFQRPYARAAEEVADWDVDRRGAVSLTDVGAQRAPHPPHRHLGPAGLVHRAHGARHGRPRAPAHHHAAVQPHGAGGGHPGRPARVDRRPGAAGHRLPVRPGAARRRRVQSSPRPTTPWSSRAWAWGWPSAAPPGSPTG